MLFQGFRPQIDNFIAVTGKVLYGNRNYPDERVKVQITEDGRPYKTIYCDDKGRFETQVLLNHDYMFQFSMDYHETSKVLVQTHVPKEISKGDVGGLFSFDCEIFERVEGMNYAVLNKPLLKIKYYPEENEFKHDQNYSNSILFDLESFKDRLNEMKIRKKEVLKDEPHSTGSKEVAQTKPKRKPIIFEEKEEPKAVNKRGHRNIMDQFNQEEKEEKQVQAGQPGEEMQSDEDSLSDALSIEENTELETEALYLEEEVDESEYIALNVVPKRIVITDEFKAEKEEDELARKQLAFEKMKRQEAVQLKRIAEEAKIREEATSFALRNFNLREQRLENKKIQNRRLRGLIKTVSLAEIYYKMEYYKNHPINHNMLKPLIEEERFSTGLIDTEKYAVKYPNKMITFTKKTYPFGIRYYFIDGNETDEDTYCSTLSDLSLEAYACTN